MTARAEDGGWKTVFGHRSPVSSGRRLLYDTEGQVLLEAVIVFPVLLLFILVVMELSMLYNAKQLANYAAFSAARTAAVYGIDSTAKRHFAAALAMSSIASTNVGKADEIIKAYWIDDPNLTVAKLCEIPGFQGDSTKWRGRLANAYLRTYLPQCDTSTASGKRKHVVVNVTYIYRCSFLPLGNVWGTSAIAAYCDTLYNELGVFKFHDPAQWKQAVRDPIKLIRDASRWNLRINGHAVMDYWAG